MGFKNDGTFIDTMGTYIYYHEDPISEDYIWWANKYDTKVINLYEYHENNNLKIKEFTIMTEEWLDLYELNFRWQN